MKKIITVGHLKDCRYLKEPAEKIIVQSTKDIDEDYPFSYLRNLNGVKEIQINDAGNVYSSGDMIFFRSERGLILSFSLGTEKNVIVPEGINIIGKNAFYNSDIESITLPESVFEISDASFMNCKSLSKVKLPNGLRELGRSVFHSCVSLESIRIPESVTVIPNSAFFDCSNLTDVKLPDGLIKIRGSVFSECRSLESIHIPESVSYIGRGAFVNCRSLSSIKVPDNLQAIEDHMFRGCSSLKEITIPEHLQRVGTYAFNDCKNIEFIEIPASVWKVGARAFCECQSLSQVNLHEGLETIGDDAFRHCKIKEISLPASVCTVGSGSLGGVKCIHVKRYISSLIYALMSGKRSFCIDCGTEKIILPGIMTWSSIEKANTVYENAIKNQNSETMVHALYYLGANAQAKHLAALSAYKLSKNEGLKKYLRRNGTKMLKCIQSEEEMLEFLNDFREIGLTDSMYEFGLALSRENNWTCATAQILEMSCKSHSSFSL